ncbi:MAG: CopD family protein [Actinomycetota bacterium]|nr:CopD family protein [Actinomycetota bacterium]
MGVQFVILRFLHELATVIWIGGMIFQAIALTPVLKKMEKNQQLQIRNSVVKIFGRVGIISIAVLAITGIIMSVGKTNSGISMLSSYGTILIIKHIITAILIVLSMVNAFAIMPRILKITASGEELKVKKAKKKMMLISFLNPFLGVAIILLSAVLAFLAK